MFVCLYFITLSLVLVCEYLQTIIGEIFFGSMVGTDAQPGLPGNVRALQIHLKPADLLTDSSALSEEQTCCDDPFSHPASVILFFLSLFFPHCRAPHQAPFCLHLLSP